LRRGNFFFLQTSTQFSNYNMSTTEPAGQAFFDRIPTTGDDEAAKCKALYDEWAKTYDQDLLDPSQDYVGPANAAKAILNYGGKLDDAVVLDVGCGTGLVGIAVRSAGGSSTIIDGADISTGMLEAAAKTGVYRNLHTVNLLEPIPISDGIYDVVICVGTLTAGHVGPVPALKEFVRVCKDGGLVVATIRENIWTKDGYEAEVRRLESEGLAKIESMDSAAYRQGQSVNAIMLVMRKTAR
jgi:ubiquinone/menaquinone biosynthesis C-methylase UbiE